MYHLYQWYIRHSRRCKRRPGAVEPERCSQGAGRADAASRDQLRIVPEHPQILRTLDAVQVSSAELGGLRLQSGAKLRAARYS
jgi:hypothetical protein